MKMVIANDADSVRKAQHRVGLGIGTALGWWFAPIVSGIACNLVEKNLVSDLLKILGRDPSDQNVDAIFWFLRKKMFLFNVVTYAPYVGTALQILEVYAIGQFTIRCATDQCMNLADEAFMELNWDVIEKDMFSGEKVVASYVQFMNEPFPKAIEPDFVKAVDVLSTIYRSVTRVPGLAPVQAFAGEGMRQGINAAKSGLRWVKDRFD